MNVNSVEDYQANLAQIERARRFLDTYQAMNEDAKKKFEYQQELARKIAEGDRARQELEILRQREALAITAPPPPPSLPQVSPPAYVQTTARIEEVSTHAEQRNVYPSAAQPHWRVQSQEPTQQHNFYTGMPQHAGDSAFRPYYHEQQNKNQQVYPTSQSTAQYQSLPVWSAYVRQLPSQQYQQQRPQLPMQAHAPNIRPAAPEARPQTQRVTARRDHSKQKAITPVSNPVTSQPQPNKTSSTLSAFANSSSLVAALEPVSPSTPETQKVPYTHGAINIRPAAPEARSQTQRMTEPHRDHSQQEAINPVSNTAAFSKPQSNNTSSTLSVFANSSSLVAALEPVSSSTVETQKSDLTHNSLPTQSQAPTITPKLYKPTSDVHLQRFTNNLDVVRYLNASYTTWVSDMPSNSYYPIPNTQYYVWKRRDNVLHFVYPTGQEYGYVDVKKFILQYAPAPPSSKGENTHLTATNQSISLSNLPQTNILQPVQATATTPAPPPSTGANTQLMTTRSSQTENLQAAQVTTTPVLTGKSNLPTQPQQRPGIDSHLNMEHAQTSPKRTPADADKRSLAHDILRALSIKRLRPPELPGTQTVERPAKRHEQEPSAPLPNGAPGTVLSDLGNPSPTTALVQTTSTEVSTVCSSTLDLPPVRIAEVPTEPESKSVEDVASSTMEEAPASGATQSTIMDVDETTDDAANSLNRLTIQEQTVIPSGEQVLQAQIEEIEEGDIQVSSGQEEAEEKEVQVLSSAPKGDEEKNVEEGVVQVPSSAPKEDEEENVEEGVVQVPSEASKVEEGEIQVPSEASKVEEGEIQVPSEAPKEDEEEEVEEGEIRMTRSPEGGKRPSMPTPPIGTNVEGDAKPVVKTPLFLPSPSSSPQEAGSPEGSRQCSAHPPPDLSILDEDSPMTSDLRDEAVLRRKQDKPHHERSSRKREFYIPVPSLPSYVRKYKEQEARQKKRRRLLAQENNEDGRKARSPSEDITSDPRVQLTIRNSVTRIAERRCKWGGCDAILNSSQNLFEHLKRNHSTPNSSKPYILCSWSGCGDHVRNEQIEEHLALHSFPSFLCPYADCDESFRSVQALVRHNDAEHASDELKGTPDPFSPHVQEPPPMPRKVSDYLIKSGLVRQEPIPRGRHAILGPWVYNNIAGPVKVTKRYNAAKDKPVEYGFLQSSSMQFSTNPSQHAKIRDLGDLPSGEVSEMISEGLYLWPPQKTASVVVSSSEDELDGFRLINTPIGDKSLVTHQNASEEDTVETMLTGQSYGN